MRRHIRKYSGGFCSAWHAAVCSALQVWRGQRPSPVQNSCRPGLAYVRANRKPPVNPTARHQLIARTRQPVPNAAVHPRAHNLRPALRPSVDGPAARHPENRTSARAAPHWNAHLPDTSALRFPSSPTHTGRQHRAVDSMTTSCTRISVSHWLSSRNWLRVVPKRRWWNWHSPGFTSLTSIPAT